MEDNRYYLGFDIWSSLDIELDDYITDEWEQDDDGGYYIPLATTDTDGNKIPDFLEPYLPPVNGGKPGTGITIPGSEVFIIGG